MKFFERFYPILTGAIIVLLVIYFSPTDLTGRYDNAKAMASLDLDKNGSLDRSEINNASAFLSGFDKNNDSSVDFTECLDHMDLARLIDKNNDDKLDVSELNNVVLTLTELDKDEDGIVELKELKK